MSIFRFQRSNRFYKKLFLSISILLILVIGVSLDIRKAVPSYFQNPILSIGYLIELTGNTIIHGISKVWTHYIDLVDTQNRYTRLQSEVEVLKGENLQLKESQKENLRLKQLLEIALPVPLKLTAAQVIMRDPSNWYQSLTINKGTDAGVLPGMGVITFSGIVGRVLKSGAKSSVVLLITDRNSAVPVLISRSRDEGILEGTTHGLARIKYLSLDLKLEVGDPVLTSGLTPTFPKGLKIGSVVKIDQKTELDRRKSKDFVYAGPFLSVEVAPAVNFSRLEEVMVITSSPDETSVQGEK
ncbi:MAG: rod shape-determining protein MreC [Nitrospirae bacterium]|nr:rod shape-determining protein MreC [Nitrospirota bacterium]MBI3353011.1 rod shape-determining protein MreC [Nitrospirota bacterium]